MIESLVVGVVTLIVGIFIGTYLSREHIKDLRDQLEKHAFLNMQLINYSTGSQLKQTNNEPINIQEYLDSIREVHEENSKPDPSLTGGTI